MDLEHKHILEIMNKGSFKTAKVIFNYYHDCEADGINLTLHSAMLSRARKYVYKHNLNLQVNDFVVVERAGAFSIAQIVEVKEDDSLIDYKLDVEYKWIVCKIDCVEYFKRIEREKILLNEINNFIINNRRKELITSMALEGRKDILDELDIKVVLKTGEEEENQKPPIQFKS